ncbi:MAG: iron ABC transporter permease [Parvularculaceae bacterium]
MNAPTMIQTPLAKAGKYASGVLLTIIAAGLGAPLAAVLFSLTEPVGASITFVFHTRAAEYVLGTVMLCLLTGGIAGLLGISTALLVALCEFPLRRTLSAALVLPLAIPPYIAAYAYGDLLSPFGPIASTFEALTGADVSAAMPDIRNLPGAAVILSLTLFPYVYLAARASFAVRSFAMMEAARTLGASPIHAVLRIFAPSARPAIAGGLALVLMETAADFGVSDYFGVSTLSIGIFRTWYGFGDLTAASQLAAMLFFFAMILVLMEEAGRRGRVSEEARVQRKFTRFVLRGPTAIGASAFCLFVVLTGFLTPLFLLISKLNVVGASIDLRSLPHTTGNTGFIASTGAILIITLAILLAYTARATKGRWVRFLLRIATLGYAVPGAVIAVGILTLLAGAGRMVTHDVTVVTGVGALLFAYASRFTTIGYNTTAAGLEQIDPSIDAAARTLGSSTTKLISRIHLPLLSKALASATIVVFVDITKELPATLILRSFNFETLATKVYRLAGDERLAEAAPHALLLIAIGLIPILILNRLGDRSS